MGVGFWCYAGGFFADWLLLCVSRVGCYVSLLLVLFGCFVRFLLVLGSWLLVGLLCCVLGWVTCCGLPIAIGGVVPMRWFVLVGYGVAWFVYFCFVWVVWFDFWYC